MVVFLLLSIKLEAPLKHVFLLFEILLEILLETSERKKFSITRS